MKVRTLRLRDHHFADAWSRQVGIILPAGIEAGHGAHLYIIRVTVTERDTFAKHLKDHYQVGTAHHYPVVWSWEAMANVEQDRSDCAIADQASRQVGEPAGVRAIQRG